MIWKDDRTEEQRRALTVLVGGKDTYLSGWGRAEGGDSWALWACRPEDEEAVRRWVQSRGDIPRVTQHEPANIRRTAGVVHVHIYVADEEHIAVRVGRLILAAESRQ